MEKLIPQSSRKMETVDANEECLFWPTSPNERMIQENIKKNPKDTQTTSVPPFSNSKIPRSNSECKINVNAESKKDSIVNTSFYNSYSIDESKYDSFDDSLDEEAHISSKKINVSTFLSEQVNVTVRKAHDRQKIKGSYLCDSLEDICSLVSNAEHFSTSDEIENINNILEKHGIGICEDSLRNDICHDNRNASLNEQYFDEDSLAILEVEKPFDDSLEDVDVASCVDSLMILGNSIGDTDVAIDKLVVENCGATRNFIETSVQIIYENAPISSDESFRTAENFNSNRNSLSLSDCPMSRDSLEEIHDISEKASSEKSLNILPKTTYDENKVCPTEKTAHLKSFDENLLGLEEKWTSTELSPTSQNRFSNTESERTSSIVNSCYFYDTFCIDDSVHLISDRATYENNSFDGKESSQKVMDADSNYLNRDNFNLMSEVTEKHTAYASECLSNPSCFQEIERNITLDNADISSTAECYTNLDTDTTDNICLKIENETSQSTVVTPVLPSCDALNINKLKFQKNENINSKIEDYELPTLSTDTEEITTSAFKDECSQNVTKYMNESKGNRNILNSKSSQNFKINELKMQEEKIGLSSLDHSSQFSFTTESSKVLEFSHYPVYRPHMKSFSDFFSSSLGRRDVYNIAATTSAYENELIENSMHYPDHGSGQINLKLQIELAIHKNCDVNIMPTSSVNQEIHNNANKPVEKSYLDTDSKVQAKTSASKNQIKQLEKANAKNEIDVLEEIMTEAQKEVSTFSKIHEHENSDDNKQKELISTNMTYCNDDKIKLGILDVQLLQALDLHDHSYNFNGRGQIQSRDSIMPLNLCIRDKLPEKRNDVLFESKENIPCLQKCKSPTDSKGISIHTKNKQLVINRDLKKPGGKSGLTTKIPIRKADNPLSIPVNPKQIKQDFKIIPCGGKFKKAPIVKSISVDSIGKTSTDEMSKKHHFCMVRNSICRVPKSLEKPNAKKFQNVESPVAKYIGNAKIHSPLKTTHRYDGNIISTLPSRISPKAASNACVKPSEISTAKKVGKKLKIKEVSKNNCIE